MAQEFLQPFEDEAKVIADGSEDGVGVVAVPAFEVVVGEMVFLWPIAASMAERRRSSFLMAPWTPRLWPER